MKKKRGFTGAGLSVVLLIFVMLCLIVFAVLSVSTAHADLLMSRKVAQRTTAYYKAQELASRQVKEIDGILTEQYNKNRNQFLDAVWEELQKEDQLLSEREENSIRCSFYCSIDDTEQICVQLLIAAPETEQDVCYRITGWQTEQKEKWSTDTGLPVLKKG